MNWGLGHASRCVPIIEYLLANGYDVLLASDGDALSFLKKRFPGLPNVALPAYHIKYRTSNMYLNISYQLPRIIRNIRTERKWLQNSIRRYAVDAVISDNRYGMYHPQIPSVFITHQLQIKLSPAWFAKAINRLNHFFISQFDQVWIPDVNSPANLSGDLSKSDQPNQHYIGPLSRFEKPANCVEQNYILFLLSGPEPMRSRFERIILNQSKDLDMPVVIVRGKASAFSKSEEGHITIYDFLDGDVLRDLIREAKYVVCRSGYSSIMDLICLQKKRVLLVPTPGQTEQEYLANRMQKYVGYVTQSQQGFHIKKAISELADINVMAIPDYHTDFDPIDQFLHTL